MDFPHRVFYRPRSRRDGTLCQCLSTAGPSRKLGLAFRLWLASRTGRAQAPWTGWEADTGWEACEVVAAVHLGGRRHRLAALHTGGPRPVLAAGGDRVAQMHSSHNLTEPPGSQTGHRSETPHSRRERAGTPS